VGAGPPLDQGGGVVQKGFTCGTLSKVNSGTKPHTLSCKKQFVVL
jgi:hypothetical protein